MKFIFIMGAVLMANLLSQPAAGKSTDTAIFAGGCFWCMQPPFEKLSGVRKVAAGYTGGQTANPTYEEVCSGTTGHFEAVRVVFDPSVVTYRQLLDMFWRNVDPTDPEGQFADKGRQYETVIFYCSEEQKKLALASKEALDKTGKFKRPVVTKILKAMPFYDAEEYHQDYSKKCPLRYKMYRMGSGRDDFIKKVWGEELNTSLQEKKTAAEPARPAKADLKKRLTPLQYSVTQENATEPPFRNDFWNNHKEGIYVDVVSGEPLFSSKDKFDSDCGWPSFTKPLKPGAVVERTDTSLFMIRTEVRSKNADSHLGHVFPDGPAPAKTRYCINSASLRFIPKEHLANEGYAEYKRLFR